MEEGAEGAGYTEGAAGGSQDPALYGGEVYPDSRHPAPQYEQQPEAKRPKRDPMWHQFTLPDSKDGVISKKRICKEPGCACIIHHGRAPRARPAMLRF